MELAQLIQLLESSVFINIRLYLLEPRKNIYLVKTLYGILFMLPQGKAYQALFKRLNHMEMIYKLDINPISVMKSAVAEYILLIII